MRRVRSQLNNLAETPENLGETPNIQQPLGFNQHTNEIQRRIDSISPQQAQMMPNPPMAQPHGSMMHQGNVMSQQPPYPMQNPHYAPQYAPPQPVAPMVYSHPIPSYQPDFRANQTMEMDNIKSSLERLTQKLQGLAQPHSGQASKNSQLQQVTSKISEQYQNIAAEMSEIGKAINVLTEAQSRPQDVELAELKSLIEQHQAMFQEHIAATKESQIDPNAYATAVEVSHTNITNQVEELRSMLDGAFAELNNAPPSNVEAAVNQALQSQSELLERVEKFETNLQGSVTASQNDILKQIKDMQEGIDALNSKPAEQHVLDTSSLDMHLEEINRAIVALSTADHGTNNLERIEARISDLSNMLDETQKSAGQAEQALDKNTIFSKFDEVNSAIESLGQSFNSDAEPQFEESINGLASQINRLSEKVDNLSALPTGNVDGTGSGDSNALLERLDVLVDRVQTFEAPVFDPSLIDKIGGKIDELGGQIKANSGDGGAADNGELRSKLDALFERVDNLETPSFDADLLSSVQGKIEDLSGQISNLSAADATSLKSSEDAQSVMEQLQYISSTVYQLSLARENGEVESEDKGVMDSIGKQLNALSEQVTNLSNIGIAPEIFSPISERLTGIEQQLGASRDIAIEVATQAAQEAVESTVSQLHSNGDGGGVSALDLTPIQQLSDQVRHLKEANDSMSSTNSDTIDTVKDIFSMMAERLSNIENQVMQSNVGRVEVAPAMAAAHGAAVPVAAMAVEQSENVNSHLEDQVLEGSDPFVEPTYDMPEVAVPEDLEISQPSLQDGILPEGNYQNPDVEPETFQPNMEAMSQPETDENSGAASNYSDMPIEPGTGGPDLAMLVRQAKERRSDHDSEVDLDRKTGNQFRQMAREASRVSQEEETRKSTVSPASGIFGGLGGIFDRNKKPILITTAIALALAVGYPVVNSLLSSGNQNTASIEQLSSSTDANETNDATISSSDELLAIQEAATDEQPVENLNTLTEPLNDNQLAETEAAETVASANSSLFSNEALTATTGFNENQTDASTPVVGEGQSIPFGNDALKAAVKSNDPIALFEVGRRYTDGVGVDKSLKEAAIWYERSAELGFAPAQYIIGNFNEKGIGVERNPAKAATWYETAANNGNVIAMHNLAVLHASPSVLSEQPDMATAFDWFKKAARYGVRDSQVNAGIFHTNGAGNGQTDLIEAYKWFSAAAQAGDSDAESKRDVVANALRPDQLEQAKIVVKDWKPLEINRAANEAEIPAAWKDDANLVEKPTGISRTQIRQVQATLSKLGFDAGPADGVMGNKTRNAISAFQKKIGMPQNGEVDQRLLEVLKQIST